MSLKYQQKQQKGHNNSPFKTNHTLAILVRVIKYIAIMLTIQDFQRLDNPNKTICIAIGLDMFNDQVAWKHQCSMLCNISNNPCSWIQGDEGIAVLWITRKETEIFEQKAILRLQIGTILHEAGIKNIDALLDKYESLTMANGL